MSEEEVARLPSLGIGDDDDQDRPDSRAGTRELRYARMLTAVWSGTGRGDLVDPCAESSSVRPAVPLDEPGFPGAAAGPPDLVLARFWRRVGAGAIDTAFLVVELMLLTIVVLIFTSLVSFIAAGGREVPSDRAPWGLMAVAIVVLQVTFSWLYSTVLHTSAWQGTIGMRLAGLEVTDLQSRRLSFARATARYAAKRLVVLTGYLGFFLIAATDRRQALHDMLAGTLVVRRRERATRGRVGSADVLAPNPVRRALDRACLISGDRLPADLHVKVAAIRHQILELLPDIERFPLGSRDLFVLERTATEYLPTSIDAYLALPQSYATTTLLSGGRTALQVLGDQLELLGRKIDEISEALRQADSERLLAHGRFLEASVGRLSEDLGLPPNRA